MVWFDRNSGGRKIAETEPVKAPEVAQPASAPVPTAPAPGAKPAPRSEPTPSPGGSSIGYLYKGSRVSGQLSFQGPARIDGVVDGEILCQGALTIGESAEIRAKITGEVVIIRGRVEGNVTAKEKVELLAQARLTGDVSTPRLVIAEGVVFDGSCSMGMAAKQVGGLANSKSVNDRAAAMPAAQLQAESKS